MATSSNLRQAASVVFAVTAVVPLLIFAWTLHLLDALSRPQAQVGLALALAMALLGYYLFRGLMGQMSSLVAGLGKAVTPVVSRSPDVAKAEFVAPVSIPGLGAIREMQDLNRAMATLWQREAAGFKGKRVVISVMNSPQSITGTLLMLSHDGLMIQTDKQDHVAVGYSRIASIDAE